LADGWFTTNVTNSINSFENGLQRTRYLKEDLFTAKPVRQALCPSSQVLGTRMQYMSGALCSRASYAS